MSAFLEIDVQLEEGRIRFDYSFEALRTEIMGHRIAVLRGVFPDSELVALRKSVHAYGRVEPPSPSQSRGNRNMHFLERGVSPRQKSFALMHNYVFNRPSLLDLPLRSQLSHVFDPLGRLLNDLAERDFPSEGEADQVRLHPTVIHYPSGGGMFSPHHHLLEPQKVQLVLNLSRRGKDFNEGGTGFAIHGETITSDDVADMGDLIIFRSDLTHWATWCDIDEALDLADERGRWIAVIPAY